MLHMFWFGCLPSIFIFYPYSCVSLMCSVRCYETGGFVYYRIFILFFFLLCCCWLLLRVWQIWSPCCCNFVSKFIGLAEYGDNYNRNLLLWMRRAQTMWQMVSCVCVPFSVPNEEWWKCFYFFYFGVYAIIIKIYSYNIFFECLLRVCVCVWVRVTMSIYFAG